MSSLAAAVMAGAHKQLPGVFHHFQHLLDHYGYVAVGVVLFAENTGVPFPGETLLIAAALYAGAGGLSIWAVAAVSIAASIAGSCFGYWVGAAGGRRLAERYGKYVFITADRLDRIEDFYARRGAWLLMLGRFVDGIRQFMSIVGGISEMTFRRFLVYSSIGAVVWCAAWSELGYVAGNHVESVSKYINYVGLAFLLLVVATVVRHVIRSRRARRG